MSRIESVDPFYLAMPRVHDIGDGSQDMLLVRVRAGGYTGWGECEAAPLPTIASMFCPMSHSTCHPVLDSVIGEPIDGPEDISRISRRVQRRSLDLLQAPHAFSGVEIALWDLLGKARGEPVYALLGYQRIEPKVAYASVLFGDTPEETMTKARGIRARGFRAAKFGWGQYGRGTVEADDALVHAARQGLGDQLLLMVDAGTVWDEDIEAARRRLPALKEAGVLWLEEPFNSGALDAYRRLAAEALPVQIAGGEGAHGFHVARQLIDHARLGYVQIDTGRIGGIGPATLVARYANSHGVHYVNHTFTSHLALSAALQPYAGLTENGICEYPAEPSPLAHGLTLSHITPASDGTITPPERPGLGLDLHLDAVRPYLRDVSITIDGKTTYQTPALTE